MLWRHGDPKHPHHDKELAAQDSSGWSGRESSTWKDVIHDLYLRMDPILGAVRQRLPDGALLIVMSDHGFAPYYRKFSLNTWLYENGYLVLEEGHAKEAPRNDPEFREVSIAHAPGTPGVVDWSRTKAYGMGFNGLYLNLAGREQDDPFTDENEGGCVQPADADALLDEIAAKLEAFVDPKNGERVVLRCDRAKTVYHGARTAEAPDLIVGYASGYDNSDPASLGRIPHDVLADNRGGTFNGSHLMAPEVVPGSLMTNGAVEGTGHRLEDLTVEILRRYGIAKPAAMTGKPVLR
jgi:predicted AlkP superfamily phosphohydrolase/phosphomutase